MKATRRKTRVFGGNRYEVAGSEPTKSKRVVDDWADFQRRVNGYNVRVVKTDGGYEGYMRKAPKHKPTTKKTTRKSSSKGWPFVF